MQAKRYALVHWDILDRHHNVDLNVLFHLNVHRTEPVLIINVLIHALIHVVSSPYAVSVITIQFAVVYLVSLAIRSHNAHQIVSPIYFQMFL